MENTCEGKTEEKKINEKKTKRTDWQPHNKGRHVASMMRTMLIFRFCFLDIWIVFFLDGAAHTHTHAKQKSRINIGVFRKLLENWTTCMKIPLSISSLKLSHKNHAIPTTPIDKCGVKQRKCTEIVVAFNYSYIFLLLLINIGIRDHFE